MKKLLSLLLLSTLLFTACQGTNTPNSSDEPAESSTSGSNSELVTYGVAGTITSITVDEDTSNGILGSIMVEGPENNGADYQEASVTVTEDTLIYLNDKASFEDLEEGQYVNVFLNDEVMESYPIQAIANQINIVPDESTQNNTED